nr:hypothetical protein DSAG12_00626 [Candidatus Prometheoarchaeum syntrophicum]
MIEKKIHNLLANEFTSFPNSELQDYYKLLFQAVYGAEHMITTYNDCLKALENEMSQIEADINCPLYSDITLSLPLIRVNLLKCKAENIDHHKISQAFFDGAKIDSKIPATKFETYLNFAAKELKKQPFNFNEQYLEEFIKNVKKLDFPTVHHSETYKKNYKPHYRVIPFQIWEKQFSKNFHNV